MARLRVLPGWAICRILVSQGFTEVIRRDSDVIMRKVRAPRPVTAIPVSDHRELLTGHTDVDHPAIRVTVHRIPMTAANGPVSR